MKYFISFLLIFFSVSVLASSFYSKLLKEAALKNNFKQISVVNKKFDKKKSSLGKKFFHDTMLSFNSDMSCGTCHLTKFSSADGLPNAVGVGGEGEGIDRMFSDGEIVPRNTLPLWGRGSKDFNTLFWDGKITQVDGEIISQLGLLTKNYASMDNEYEIIQDFYKDPLISAVHLPFVEIRELVADDEEVTEVLKKESIDTAMNVFYDLTERIKKNSEYTKEIKEIYNLEVDQIEFFVVADAIAHFIRDEFAIKETIFSDFVFNDGKLNDDAIRGGLLFYGKAKCSSCHSGTLFSDLDFHSIPYPQVGFGKNGFGVDYGRFNVTYDPDDLYKFRTPPLINVEFTKPYSHSGSVFDLKEAIRYHFDPLKNLDLQNISDLERVEMYKKLKISGQNINQIPYLDENELDQLVEFLKTLSFK